MLAIEVDGLYRGYKETVIKDNFREQKLASFGIKVIRFSESEVKYDTFNVIIIIESAILDICKANPKLKFLRILI